MVGLFGYRYTLILIFKHRNPPKPTGPQARPGGSERGSPTKARNRPQITRRSPLYYMLDLTLNPKP